MSTAAAPVLVSSTQSVGCDSISLILMSADAGAAAAANPMTRAKAASTLAGTRPAFPIVHSLFVFKALSYQELRYSATDFAVSPAR